MFLKHYFNQIKEKKRVLEEQERLFMDIVNEKEKTYLEKMGEELKEESTLEKEAEMDNGKPIIELEKLGNKEYYDQLMKKIRKIKRRMQRKKLAAAFGLTAIITFFTTGYVTHANPFHFFIQIVEFVDGKIKAKPDLEKQGLLNAEELDIEIYQVEYMTKDYVLMREEVFDNFYKMHYYKDIEHFVIISQTPAYNEKNFSLTDETEYQTILIDGMECFLNINLDTSLSTLFFIKDNTSITIKGTIPKEEILQIANGLYKEYD